MTIAAPYYRIQRDLKPGYVTTGYTDTLSHDTVNLHCRIQRDPKPGYSITGYSDSNPGYIKPTLQDTERP